MHAALIWGGYLIGIGMERVIPGGAIPAWCWVVAGVLFVFVGVKAAYQR